MNIERIQLPILTIIGKEGSTNDGPGFIQSLWAEANSHFGEIEPLVMREADGTPSGFWGAMTDFSRSFLPWENNFSQGLYLAGAQCVPGSQPPEGWTKWTIPGYEYLCAEVESGNTFSEVLDYLKENNIALVGAVHDFTCPSNGKSYMYFPIRMI